MVSFGTVMGIQNKILFTKATNPLHQKKLINFRINSQTEKYAHKNEFL